jgi:hypothetical protein
MRRPTSPSITGGVPPHCGWNGRGSVGQGTHVITVGMGLVRRSPLPLVQCPRTFYTVLDTLICKSLDTDFVLPLVWVVHFA